MQTPTCLRVERGARVVNRCPGRMGSARMKGGRVRCAVCGEGAEGPPPRDGNLLAGRRGWLLSIVAGTGLSGAGSALAMKLPSLADSAWQALGGGPGDLYFPQQFLGLWEVTSVLVKVEVPLGEELLPDPRVVRRARLEDLDHPLRYQISFIKDEEGHIIYDRRYNMASLISHYYGDLEDRLRQISWDANNPNILQVALPGGMSVRTRVTRRSETTPAADRIETSEYIEQIYEDGLSGNPKVKASQCFTKFKWRSEAATAAGSPSIVATQVVSDYLTPYDGDENYMKAMNRPVVMYTYKMSFSRPT